MTFRVLIIAVVVIMVVYQLRRLLGRLQASTSASSPMTNGGRLVKDPVCGTYVPADSSLSAGNEFFCSLACQAKYLKNSR